MTYCLERINLDELVRSSYIVMPPIADNKRYCTQSRNRLDLPVYKHRRHTILISTENK